MRKYIVKLTQDERADLQKLIGQGDASARKLTHARILLKADSGETGPGWSDQAISEALEVGTATVERVRERFVEEGLDASLTQHRPVLATWDICSKKERQYWLPVLFFVIYHQVTGD